MARTPHDAGVMLVAEKQQNVGPAAIVLRRRRLVAPACHGNRAHRRYFDKCPSFHRYPFTIAENRRNVAFPGINYQNRLNRIARIGVRYEQWGQWREHNDTSLDKVSYGLSQTQRNTRLAIRTRARPATQQAQVQRLLLLPVVQ